jgi:hypothetical protein
MDGTDWAILFGTLTLICWMGAGLIAVLGTGEEIRHGEAGIKTELATVGLAVAGLTSVLAMAAAMVSS